MPDQDFLTYLCKKHKVPMTFVEFVDQPHWSDEVEGYYVPKVHILCIWKGTKDPDLVLAHEFDLICLRVSC